MLADMVDCEAQQVRATRHIAPATPIARPVPVIPSRGVTLATGNRYTNAATAMLRRDWANATDA